MQHTHERRDTEGSFRPRAGPSYRPSKGSLLQAQFCVVQNVPSNDSAYTSVVIWIFLTSKSQNYVTVDIQRFKWVHSLIFSRARRPWGWRGNEKRRTKCCDS